MAPEKPDSGDAPVAGGDNANAELGPLDTLLERLRAPFAGSADDAGPVYSEAADGTRFSRTGSGGTNLLPPGDLGNEAASYMKLPPTDGAFEVITHGSTDGTVTVDRGNGAESATPAELADLIRQSGWREGQPVRMAVCHAGLPGGCAQQVADILRVPVEASPDSVWVSRSGKVIKPGGGLLQKAADMRTFLPRGNR